MNEMDLHPSVKQMIRITRIIVIALVAGVCFFAGFVVMNKPQPMQKNQQPMMTWMSAAFAVMAAVSSTIIPPIIARSNVKAVAQGRFPAASQVRIQNQYTAEMLSTDEAKLAMVYQQMTIIRGAIVEGATFFVWFAYWQEGQLLALAIGIGLIVLLLFCFPMTSRVERWMENRLRELFEMRLLQR